MLERVFYASVLVSDQDRALRDPGAKGPRHARDPRPPAAAAPVPTAEPAAPDADAPGTPKPGA